MLKTLIIVIIVIFFLLNICKKEIEDIYYPQDKKQDGIIPKIQKDGYGRNYVYGKAEEKDKVRTLLNKISWLADCDSRVVKWRRSMILGFFIVFLYFIIPDNTDVTKSFFLKVILTSIVIYHSFSFYHYHHDRYASQYIKENVHIIKDKLKLPSKTSDIKIYKNLQ